MKKNNYSLVQANCSGRIGYIIHEAVIPHEQEEGTVVSEANFKQSNIGTLFDFQPSCCCTNAEIGRLELNMYDQQLSIAETYDKSCLGLHWCGHEVVVMTAKRVLIGRIIRTGRGCSGNVLEVRSNQDKIIYNIRSPTCQLKTMLPKCLGWIVCGKSAHYEIVSETGEVVGDVRIDGGCKQQIEIKLPQDAETKSKILLMNCVALII